MNYYERHIGDYLKDTAHLSLLEHGVYSRLLDVYYTREGAIPVDQVERLIGARTKDERAALAAVVDEFFTADAGLLRHSRCDREIARFQDKQRKASASANARWSKSVRTADVMRTHSEGNAHHTPYTSNQSPDPNTHTHIGGGSDAGRVCGLMRSAGVADVNPGHPDLLALIGAGCSDGEFIGVAQSSAEKGKGFAYALGTLRRQREDAARLVKGLHHGPLPVTETAKERAARERVEQFAPGAAKRRPSTGEVVDVATRRLG